MLFGTGLISTETDLAKNQKMWYTYDELKRVTKRRLTNLSGALIKEENFTYDAAGNIESTNAWYEDQNFVYDSNNKLIEYNGQPVTYDADGNMLSATITCMNRSFEYDSANRLVKADAYRYIYDGEDVRIKSVYYTTETEYVFNTNAKLSQLLQKSTNGVITKYVYGLGLIGEEKFGTFKTYHFDYRGSTSAITDIYGNITDTFSYDTYGNLLSRSGYYTDTPFMYNGRDGVMTDNNGLIYMRARYYCPELRRFINADILHGEISDSTSLNRYSYVNGNPVSFIDPFGLIKDRGMLLWNSSKTRSYITQGPSLERPNEIQYYIVQQINKLSKRGSFDFTDDYSKVTLCTDEDGNITYTYTNQQGDDYIISKYYFEVKSIAEWNTYLDFEVIDQGEKIENGFLGKISRFLGEVTPPNSGLPTAFECFAGVVQVGTSLLVNNVNDKIVHNTKMSEYVYGNIIDKKTDENVAILKSAEVYRIDINKRKNTQKKTIISEYSYY